jgi:16S rRNA (adenine1518-N6/adenine1519-N6)-dimethyltransferase
MVRPKKFLGQHFLRDQNIASKIVEALELSDNSQRVIEIGPGTGVLTQLLVKKEKIDLWLIEIDRESVAYLKLSFNLKYRSLAIFHITFLRKFFSEFWIIEIR